MSSLRIVLFIFQHEYTFIGKQISEHEQLANCQNQDNESDDPGTGMPDHYLRVDTYTHPFST